MPRITSVAVSGGQNNAIGDPYGPDGEVCLDIEVVGAVAPGASIAVYFAYDASDKSFIDAISTAVHDDLRKPSVISISWGGAEDYSTPQFRQAMENVFLDAASKGITVCCSAGDDGSIDLRFYLDPTDPTYEPDDGLLHTDYPGSSPSVLACGGTKLEGSGNTISSEVVWNGDCQNPCGTGGGVSDQFDLPDYQAHANVPPSANTGGKTGRGVPDVAGDADPSTGYQILVDGQPMTMGGTSAVAPLWAGLIALFNQKLGNRVGFLNPVLYSLPANTNAFHDITIGNNDIKGNNGPYQANAGWDACTGLGSPDGTKLLNALSER